MFLAYLSLPDTYEKSFAVFNGANMLLNRRQFVQAAGITLAASVLPLQV
ncbi:MAG: hypothetical protein ACR5K4_04030 [Sodalis sp. (in: enterobacteria)]